MTARCQEVGTCSDRHCVLCVGHLEPTELQTCVRCLARVHRDLVAVVDLFALLPDQLVHRSGQTALALLAPGSVGAFWRDAEVVSRLESTPWRPAQRLRHAPLIWSEDPAEQAGQAAAVEWEAGSENPHRMSDPPSVAFELGQWEDDWRSVRGEPAATEAGSVAGAVGYLSVRAGWAADHHPAFDDFAVEVARLRSRLEVATSMDSRPLIGVGVVCFECGVELRREWVPAGSCRHRRPSQALSGVPLPRRHHGPERLESVAERHARLVGWAEDHAGCDLGGLSDEWTCPRCWRAYDQESYWLAVREHLEKSGEGV